MLHFDPQLTTPLYPAAGEKQALSVKPRWRRRSETKIRHPVVSAYSVALLDLTKKLGYPICGASSSAGSRRIRPFMRCKLWIVVFFIAVLGATGCQTAVEPPISERKIR